MSETAASTTVFMKFNQDELRQEYNPGSLVPNRQKVLGRIVGNSEAVCGRLGAPREFRYGSEPTSTIAAYSSGRKRAPVHIHFHGGGWRYFDARSLGGFMAETYLDAGAHLLLPNFDGADKNGGNLLAIADQVRRAVVWVHQHSSELECDPNQIYVSGHSSGAHLASTIATTNWAEYGLEEVPVQAVMCVSGMYELAPVTLSGSYPNVTFSEATISELSARRHIDRIACRMIIACSTIETSEFIRQGRDFAGAISAAGKSAKMIETELYNHFEIVETLASPYGLLGKEMLNVMKHTAN